MPLSQLPADPGDAPGRPNQEFHLVAERWVIGLCEPLIPAEAKIRAEQSMVELFEGPGLQWALAFGSVFLHGLVFSLPADDPWRHVRYLVPGGPQRFPVELTEGGWAGTRRFGQVADVTDLTTADQLDNPEVDFVTAGSLFGVPGWFSAGAAALVGAAGDSWRASLWALAVKLERGGAQTMFADLVQATSAVLHRRRVYLGSDVELPVHLMVSLAFADRGAAALGGAEPVEPLVEAAEAAEVFGQFEFMAEVVPAGSYQRLRHVTDDLL